MTTSLRLHSSVLILIINQLRDLVELQVLHYDSQPGKNTFVIKSFFILVEVVINMEVGLRKVGSYAKNSDDFHIGFFM